MLLPDRSHWRTALLARRIVIEPASAIADQVSYDQGDLDRIASQSRLVSANDDVTALRIREKLAESFASQEVIACAPVIDIRHDGILAELLLLDQLATSSSLDIKAELLLALIIL